MTSRLPDHTGRSGLVRREPPAAEAPCCSWLGGDEDNCIDYPAFPAPSCVMHFNLPDLPDANTEKCTRWPSGPVERSSGTC